MTFVPELNVLAGRVTESISQAVPIDDLEQASGEKTKSSKFSITASSETTA
tara:strand:+ start:531 stop:683 length:153 start_codon:yes stop_codon:yes gene_type:complete